MKRLLFWEFRRGSWQYDVVVILLLGFIFLTPRTFFRDQPKAASVVQVPIHSGATAYWIDSSVLTATSEEGRRAQAADLVSKKTGHKVVIERVELIPDSEKETQGYMAFLRH